MGLLRLIFLFSFLFLNTLLVRASENKCNLFSPAGNFLKVNSWHYFDRYDNFDYSRYSRVLFLNDNGRGGSAIESSSDKLVISSDFKQGGNIRVDNNNLPFVANAFNLIVMNRGLCPCHGPISCGGIKTGREDMKKFLLSVVDILDKNDKQSLALLTGYYFPGEMRTLVPTLWMEIVKELQPLYPNLSFAILSQGNSADVINNFIGIVISADPNTAIEKKLNTLSADLVTVPD